MDANKKTKFLFVGSLPTKKYYFDGERNKSRDVLNALVNRFGKKCSVINLSLNQFVQVAKMVFLSRFFKYDFVFVSKCFVGGSRAIKYLQRFAKKHNKNKIIFYLIGNGSNGFDDKVIYYDYVKRVRHVIVESPDVERELISKDIAKKESISIIPCLKPNYSINPIEKKYPSSTLKLIYFSRITELKGIMDAILAISKINDENGRTFFELDIAGGSGFDEKEQMFLNKIKQIANQKEYINYLGLNLRIKGIDSYKQLQSYDLHIFPSKFYQECAPGSIIDMFIAGVPTLSSNFPSAKYIMSDKDSFFFKMNDIEDLENELMLIYNNQQVLNKKRINSHNNAKLYSEERFIMIVETILRGINK